MHTVSGGLRVAWLGGGWWWWDQLSRHCCAGRSTAVPRVTAEQAVLPGATGARCSGEQQQPGTPT